MRNTFIGFMMLLLAGCATNDAQMVTPDEFSNARSGAMQARILRSGDALELAVEVNGVREVPLTRVEIDYEGSIPAPLVGNLDVASMTLTDARTALEASYGRIFVAPPLITLRLAGDDVGEWGYVTVLGLVRSPGRLAVASSAGMNLSDALHEAGGFDQSADMQGVVVTRQASDGRLVQCECDMTKIGRKGTGQFDLVLFDGDIVYIPERLF